MPGKPAPKGNKRAVTHGAHAEIGAAQLDHKAMQIYEALAAAAPVREGGQLPPADAFLVAQLARTLARLDRLAAWLDVHGVQDRRGKIRSAARWESKLTAQAVGMMDKLGMSPTSRAKLGLNLMRTVSLAEAMSEPDPLRRTELMRQAGVDTAGVGGVEDV